MNSTSSPTDVAIIGGAIMGSATAYFFKSLSPSPEVKVIEPDPTYEYCSTLRASAAFEPVSRAGAGG